MTIREHLQLYLELGFHEKQEAYFKFLIEKGESFTERQDLQHKPALMEMVNQNECFRNSILTNISTKFDYYEGFYITGNIPFYLEHAFNKDPKTGLIYDVTAQKFNIPVKEWYGIKIPNEVLEEFQCSKYVNVINVLQFYIAEYIFPQMNK